MRSMFLLTLLLVPLAGCPDDGGPIDEGEVITTVTLDFVPTAGPGARVTASFDDPDGDGGEPPVIDTIGLLDGTTYALSVTFLNRLEDPAEDITPEVRDEGDQHQLFFTGTAVRGPASDRPTAPLLHAYADQDAGGLPIGLANTIVVSAGAGEELTVTLLHLPPVNDAAVKTAATADTVRTMGFGAAGGEIDAQVTFPVAIAVP